jgi:tetratricopeptide (TPR) repeat protein
MFEEVLEIDIDDPLATFGMGAAYIQLSEYEKAIPFLEHATKVNKDYSAAYLNLGKCLEFTGRHEQARDAFRKGIEVATRKGDLMPLREMERRLNALPTSTAG